ncbi:hypothetical protein NDU88_000681 [Pleurodeles waltl]|uniref:Uncharacterized protein n=1 Tax=Pleurodeles waltl TaxID=8319 RepID=A0AAV7WJM1_PLEWA|nr:hypothetical protein NDU88_000681 [Pleurodeles waltl]
MLPDVTAVMSADTALVVHPRPYKRNEKYLMAVSVRLPQLRVNSENRRWAGVYGRGREVDAVLWQDGAFEVKEPPPWPLEKVTRILARPHSPDEPCLQL